MAVNINLDANDLANQIILALKPLADKLGQGAGQVYKLAVKDAYITGWEEIIISGFFFLLMTGIDIYLVQQYRKTKSSEFMGVMAFITFIGLIITIPTACSAFHNLLNPEYAGLTELLQKLRY